MAYSSSEDYKESSDLYEQKRDLYATSITQLALDEHFATMEDAWGEMDDASRRNKAGLALVGAGWLAAVADAWFFGGGSKEASLGHASGTSVAPWALQPVQGGDGVALRVALEF